MVKSDFYAFLRFCKVPKTRINKGDFFSVCNGFGDLLFGAARRFCPRGLPACSRYQSRRATVLANLFAMYNAPHPEILYCFLFGFLSFSRSCAASGCCHQIGSLCSLFGQRPSFFLAASATGGARKRPHLRYTPMINGTIITRCAWNVKCIKKSLNPEN